MDNQAYKHTKDDIEQVQPIQERPVTADKKQQPRKKSSISHRLSGQMSINTDGHDINSDAGSMSNSPSMPVDLGAMLRQNSLFSSVTALQEIGINTGAFIDEIANQMHLRHYQIGDVVIREGEVGKAMFLVLRGWVTVASKDGELVYADLGQGKFFGEISLLFDMPRTANVIAKTKCLLAVLTQTELQMIMKQFPEVSDEMKIEAEDRFRKLMAKKQLKAAVPSLPAENVDSQKVPDELLAQFGDGQKFDKGHVFYKQGQQASQMVLYVVKSGLVSLKNSDLDHTYLLLSEGCYFGESVVGHLVSEVKQTQMYTETAVASSQCQIVILTDVEQLVKSNAQFRQNIQRSSQRSQSWYYLMMRRKSGNQGISRNATATSLKGIDIVVKNPSTQSVLNVESISSSEKTLNKPTDDIELKKLSASSVDQLQPRRHMSSSSLLNATSTSINSMSAEASNVDIKRNSTWTLQVQSLDQHEEVVEDLINGSTSQVPQALSPWSKTRDPNALIITIEQLSSSNGDVSEVSHVTEEDEDDDEDEEEPDEFIVESAKAISPTNRLTQLANSVDPKKRRASIAVWTDQKLTDMSNNKAQQQSPKPSVSAKNRYANVFSPQSTVESDSESDDSQPDDSHPLLNAQILGNIFKFLPFRSTWQLRAVCHKWKHVIHRSSDVVKRIDLSDYSKYIDDNVLDNIAQHVNCNVEVLILRNCWKVTNNGMRSLAQNCRQINILDLCGCWEITDEGLMSLSLGCRFIKAIDLSNCRKVNDAGMLSLFQNCNQLQDVYVSYCKALSDSVLGYIQNMAPNIRRLNFQRCLGITDQGFTIMGGGMTDYQMRYQKLQEILLSDCSFLSDSAMEDISMMCPNLKILNVSFCCALTELSWQYLTEGCKRMRILDASFCGNSVSDDSLEVMSTQWPELQALSIRGCNRVSNAGLLHLYQNSFSLKKLNVTSCKNIDVEAMIRAKQTGVKWQFLGAQVPVVDGVGISGTSDALGSSHIRRYTAP